MSEERYYRFNLIALVAISFLVTIGFGAVNLIVPYYILALKGVLTKLPEHFETLPGHKAVVEMGVMVTAFMATRAIIAMYVGSLSDYVGRKKLIATGMAIYVAVGILYAMTNAVWQLYVLRALQGVASAMVWPVAETLLVESVPAYYRTRALSYYVIAMQAGHILGPMVGAVAYEVSRSLIHGSVVDVLRAPFLLIAFTTLPGLMLALATRETMSKAANVSRRVLRAAVGDIVRFLGEIGEAAARAIKAFYVNGLINGFAMGIVMSVMINYVLEFIVADPVLIATAMTVAGVVGSIGVVYFARLADRLDARGKKRLLVLTGLLGRLAWGLMAFVRSYIQLLLVMIFAEVVFNAFMPLLRSVQADLVPEKARGKLFGMQQAFFNIGMAAGPLIGAAIYKAFYKTPILGLTGPQWVFVGAALMGVVGVTLIAIYYRPEEIEAERRLVVVTAHGTGSPG